MLLGFQIANAQGENVQGGDGIDVYPSYEILTAKMAIAYVGRLNVGLEARERFLLQPIYEGDIEEPTLNGSVL